MIKLEKLTKIFETVDGTLVAVDRVSMEVPQGEVCVLLGPTGCGKTTLLKMVNRLIEPTSGKVFVGGRETSSYDIVELRHQLGYVIQQIGLFPNMTVAENIAVVPRLLGWESERIRRRVDELLVVLDLEPAVYRERYPRQLGKGTRQRVGLLRALAADPPVLLMDEPFTDADPVNRERMQAQFVALQAQLRKTVLFVSHDIDEAIKIGDKIAVLNNGALEQFGVPDDVLALPATSFIADFIGGSERVLKRLRLITVAEAMDPNAPRVHAEDSLEEAARLMREYGHENIVLVGPRGRARGVVYLTVAREERGTCGDHRAGLKATVNVKADLRTAVSLMFTHSVTWLACVDDEGFYRGHITQQGITHLLGEAYLTA